MVNTMKNVGIRCVFLCVWIALVYYPTASGFGLSQWILMIGVKKNRVAEHNLPSGILSHNYGKSPFFMGKSTISMAIFYVANC